MAGVVILVLAAVVAWFAWPPTKRSTPAERTATISTADSTAPRLTALEPPNRGATDSVTTRVRGVVLDTSSEGVIDATVCGTALGSGASTCTTSRAGGRFDLALIGAGRAALVAYGPGLVATAWGSAPRHPTIELHGRPIDDVTLHVRTDGVALRGTVVDRLGGAIADAIVVAGSGTHDGIVFGERTSTDDAGRFVLTVDPTNDRVIGAFATGYAAGGARVVSPIAGAEVEIVLDPEARIDGVVVDAESGDALPGLQVVAPEAPVTAVAISDARGRFSLRGLPAGQYRPEASGEGVFGRVVAPVVVDVAGVAEVRIEVRPTARILVEVVDPDGPCAAPRFDAKQGDSVVSVVGSRSEAILHVARSGLWVVSMACDAVTSDGIAIDTMLGADVDAALQWYGTDGGRIRGRVLRDARGLGGEPVKLFRDDDVLQTTTSGDGGRFELTHVPAGRYHLAAGHGRAHAMTITIEGNEDVDVDLVSPSLASIRVRVEQVDGTPCPNAQVRTRGDEVSHACQTDDTGVCSMVGLAATSTELFVPTNADIDAPTDAATALASVVADLVGGTTTEVTLRIPERRRTIGGVVWHDGERVPGAHVTVRRDSDDRSEAGSRVRAAATTDADGRFAIGGLPDGTWAVHVIGPTGAAATVGGVTPGESRTIVIATEGPIAGTVSRVEVVR